MIIYKHYKVLTSCAHVTFHNNTFFLAFIKHSFSNMKSKSLTNYYSHKDNTIITPEFDYKTIVQ